MPLDPYPTDPWNNRKYWPANWGQLTNVSNNVNIRVGVTKHHTISISIAWQTTTLRAWQMDEKTVQFVTELQI